jgi:hypothetical protein
MEDKIISPVSRPRYFAQRCPTCNGFTTVSYGTKMCQTCKGNGYVAIPLEEQEEDGGNTHDDR